MNWNYAFYRRFFFLASLLISMCLGGCGGSGGSGSDSRDPAPTAAPTASITATPAATGTRTPQPTITPTATPTAFRVACVGDSITEGVGVFNPVTEAYPSVLSQLLGKGYRVQNFGVSRTTLLSTTAASYMSTPAYAQALSFQPDILTVALGTNDSVLAFDTKTKSQFQTDYETLVAAFRRANPKVKVYLCLPVPSYPMNAGMNLTLSADILPLIRQVANDKDAQIIDLYTPLSEKQELFPDGVHPNATGAKLIAAEIYHGISE